MKSIPDLYYMRGHSLHHQGGRHKGPRKESIPLEEEVCVCCAKMGWKIQLAKSLLKEHELEQTLGESEGKGSLVCYSPWGPKDSDTT